MTNTTKLAAAVLATILSSVTLAQAGALIDVTPDNTPVSIDSQDDTPVDLDTYDAPVPVDYYAPITTPQIKYDGPSLLGNGAKKSGRGDVVVALGCEVAGTPSEFPDDLYIVNEGNVPLAAGTRIKWQVKSSGLRGAFALNTDIAVGSAFKASGILDGGVEPGVPCTAKVI